MLNGVRFVLVFVSSALTKKNSDLIELDESVPSVRQQLLKEQLDNLYHQPVRVNAFRGTRAKQSLDGVVTLRKQEGSAAAASESAGRSAPAENSAGQDH